MRGLKHTLGRRTGPGQATPLRETWVDDRDDRCERRVTLRPYSTCVPALGQPANNGRPAPSLPPQQRQRDPKPTGRFSRWQRACISFG